jgi:hypothetical protein
VKRLRYWIGPAAALAAAAATAKPIAPAEFCRVYPDSAFCAGTQPDCGVCHTAPPERNAFGAAVESNLAVGTPRPLSDEAFALALPEALHAVESLDVDDDGYANLEELLTGAKPASPESRPDYRVCTPAEAAEAAEADWDLCAYDPRLAYKRVLIDVCGTTPTLADLRAFAETGDPTAALHATLDDCLSSDHWRGVDGVLWNLANEKILPIASIKSGDNAGPIPLADYTDDYNLFIWAMSGGRDARDLLLADYVVERDDAGVLTTHTRTIEEEFATRGYGTAQFVVPERRAGMITMRWFLMSNTMFTAVPRTTAAQAYRAYLGADIARMEGLHSVANEPVDFDAKGVQRPECAACHATLDPLTYPFSRYEGIGGGDRSLAGPPQNPLGLKVLPFSYNPNRLERFPPVEGDDVVNTPEAGVIFGETVKDLIEWAAIAANSDAFARKIVVDLWTLLIGAPPGPGDTDELNTLISTFMTTHEYRVERLIHALIDTEAYGVP